MDKTEQLILQIIEQEGGRVPSMFFIKKLLKMEEKGLLRVDFPGKSHTHYDFVLPGVRHER
jgi:hypothetical protein